MVVNSSPRRPSSSPRRPSSPRKQRNSVSKVSASPRRASKFGAFAKISSQNSSWRSIALSRRASLQMPASPVGEEKKVLVVLAIGHNDYGQCGTGNKKNCTVPVPLPIFNDKIIVKAACGSEFTCAVTDGGELYSWGCNDYGQLGHGDRAHLASPKKVESILLRPGVDRVACGADHVMIVTNQRRLISWGRNDKGQAGLEREILWCPTPQEVSVLKKRRIWNVCCGVQHSVAVGETGEMYMMGRRAKAGVRDASDAPAAVQIDNVPPMQKVSAGMDFTISITPTGELYTWGENAQGQLGLGHTREVLKPTRVNMFLGKLVRMAECGVAHCLALIAVQDAVLGEMQMLYTWGWNLDGQLGHGSTEPFCATPRPVTSVIEQKITRINCAANVSFAVTDTGVVYSCGSGAYMASTRNTTVMRAATYLRTYHVGSIECGGYHAVLIAKQGRGVEVITGQTASDNKMPTTQPAPDTSSHGYFRSMANKENAAIRRKLHVADIIRPFLFPTSRPRPASSPSSSSASPSPPRPASHHRDSSPNPPLASSNHPRHSSHSPLPREPPAPIHSSASGSGSQSTGTSRRGSILAAHRSAPNGAALSSSPSASAPAPLKALHPRHSESPPPPVDAVVTDALSPRGRRRPHTAGASTSRSRSNASAAAAVEPEASAVRRSASTSAASPRSQSSPPRLQPGPGHAAPTVPRLHLELLKDKLARRHDSELRRQPSIFATRSRPTLPSAVCAPHQPPTSPSLLRTIVRNALRELSNPLLPPSSDFTSFVAPLCGSSPCLSRPSSMSARLPCADAGVPSMFRHASNCAFVSRRLCNSPYVSSWQHSTAPRAPCPCCSPRLVHCPSPRLFLSRPESATRET